MSELGIGQKLTPMLREKVLGGGLESARIDRASTQSVGSTSSVDFLSSLESAIQDTNVAIKEADKLSVDFAAGRAKNLHDVTIAMEKADLSLRTLTAVRGKVLEAYQEIMRMQV